jgi:hypothetical protein
VVGAGDAYRQMRAVGTTCSMSVESPVAAAIRLSGNTVRTCDEAERHGDLRLGPASVGATVLGSIEPDHARHGPSAAPIAVSALALADDLWSTGIGPLLPARQVR